MDENKKQDEPESSDNSEKIEVKVTTEDESEATEKPIESLVEQQEAVVSNTEEPPLVHDELVPPPATEGGTEAQDEGALEEIVPKLDDAHTVSDTEQLSPVATPPEESQVKSNPDIPSVAAAPASIAVTQQAIEAHPHRNNKKLAILITIFVGVMLAAIAVYVYMSANSNTKESNPAPNSSTQQSQEQTTQKTVDPATVNDLDTTTEEVDKAIDSLDDASDFSEDQLSDESLGL